MSTVGFGELLDGVLAKLRPLLIESQPAPAGAYLRVLDLYAGEFSSREAWDAEKAKFSGRMPVVLVDFVSDRVIRTMVGGRVQFVEATIAVICMSDSRRSRSDRQAVVLDQVVADVRAYLSNVRLALPVSPLRYAGLQLVAKEPQLFAYACRFTTRFHTDASTSAAELPRLAGFQGLLRQVGGSGELDITIDLPEEP